MESGWSAAKTVIIGPPSDEHAPTADASDIDIGNVPKTMHPNTFYTVTAKYYDVDGRDNLKNCYLRINRPLPVKALTMMWYQVDGNYDCYAGDEGKSYLTISNVLSTKIPGSPEGYELVWVFKINDSWPEVESAINFGVFASDDDGLDSGDWHYDNTKASFILEETGTVTGRVTDASIPGPSNGIAGAVLLLDPDPLTYSPVTLNQGYFSFSITAGTYNITASASGYSSLTESVTVTTGEPTKVNFALTNVVTNGFRMGFDSWRFSNAKRNMWPASWWSQFDYSFPEYPLAWELWPISARPQDFPNWDLFVDAFGEDSCYINPPPGLVVYSPSAVIKWSCIKKYKWPGACFGFPTTAFMFFDKELTLSATFPGNDVLYDVPITVSSRSLINEYYLHQYGSEHQRYMANQRTKTPNETLDEIRQMMEDSAQGSRILILLNQNGDGGHAVGPYRIEPDSNESDKYYVDIYDNNWPESTSCRITIDTSANTWSYFPFPHRDQPVDWGGTKGLFLMEEVNEYTSSPPLKALQRGLQESGVLPRNGNVEFYVQPQSDITIETDNGTKAGHVRGSSFFELDQGTPIIPITGQENPPIGYYLPAQHYNISTNALGQDAGYLTALSQDSCFTLRRTNLGYSTTDSLQWESRELVVGSMASYGGRYDIHIILNPGVSSGERVAQISDYDVQAGPSTVSVVNSDTFQVTNHGEADEYRLKLRYASANGDVTVAFSSITIASNSSQHLIPDWESLEEAPLKIEVDNDLDGKTDKTLTVTPFTEEVSPPEFINQGPNPVPDTGTAFFYTLPVGTSMAKLMVFSATSGRLLFETSIDVTQTRFPVSGTWDPVDNDGIKLANGPYLYVLIADGQLISQGKMVIQR